MHPAATEEVNISLWTALYKSGPHAVLQSNPAIIEGLCRGSFSSTPSALERLQPSTVSHGFS